jgi:hypothetical protein
MKQLNTYTYADGSVDDADSLIKTYDNQRNGFASLSIDNLSNTAVPVLRAGSLIEIKGSFFQSDSDETLQLYDGATFTPASNMVIGTAYYLCLIPIVNSDAETSTAYFAAKSINNIEYVHDYRGWFETNTKTKIIGGICQTAAGVYAVSSKWLMTHNPLSYILENPTNPMIRYYVDGFEAKFRINKDPINLYNSTTATNHTTTPINLVTFPLSSSANLQLTVTGNNYAMNGASYEQQYLMGAHGKFEIIYMDGSTELSTLDWLSRSFTVPPLTAQGTYTFIVPLGTTGIYKIRFTPGTYEHHYNASHTNYYITAGLTTTSIKAELRDVLGAIKGTY